MSQRLAEHGRPDQVSSSGAGEDSGLTGEQAADLAGVPGDLVGDIPAAATQAH